MTLRILLAEDNENLAQILARFIESRGDTVVRATSGTQTVRELSKGSTDILLLDLGLPEISGVEILQKIRRSSKLADLPVIIITGIYKGDNYAKAALKLGVEHYLEKPFSRESFEAALDRTAAQIVQKSKATLLQTLLTLYNTRKSGLLTISGYAPITFVNGEISSFLAKGKKDFPEYLLAKGSISREDMQLFMESGEERIFFTESGILNLEELATESALYIKRLLTENLSRTDGIHFEETAGKAEPPLLQLPIPETIYEAIKQVPEQFQSETFLAQSGSLFPARTALFYRRANLITMREADIRVLERINGEKSVSELVKEAGNSHDPVLFINFLHVLGMISLNSAPGAEATPEFHLKALFNRPLEESRLMEEVIIDFGDIVEEVADNVVMAMGNSSMAEPLSEKEISFEQAVQREFVLVKDKDYYSIFDMTPAKFSFNTLKEAYFAKMREYSPERFMELSGTTSAMAQDILSIYADAYNTLSNVVAKERYDEMLNDNKTMGIDGKQDGKLHARIQFQSGKVFLDMGEYENAEKALQEAYTLEPDNSAHAAFLAWAIYNNSSNSKSRAALEKARSLLSKSLQIEKIPEAFAFRGWMLYDEGRDGLAEGEFQKALKMNPKEPTAQKGIKLLNEKRESDKKGVFRRLFN